MVYNWFEVKITFKKNSDTAEVEEKKQEKPIHEVYLIDALTFTDAERRIQQEQGNRGEGELVIESVRRTKFHEFFLNDGDFNYWFRCKVKGIILDEENPEKSKKQTQVWLIQADSFQEATTQLYEEIENQGGGLEVEQVNLTNIYDIYQYEAPTAEPSKNE